jgi:transcriptional regulator with XRE-family HTH domain
MTQIKLLRLERELTSSAVAEQVKLSGALLSLVERGQKRASDRTRLRLCRFFGVPETELFDGDGLAVKVDIL